MSSSSSYSDSSLSFNDSSYVFAGYVLVLVNASQKRYLPLYNRFEHSSSSSSSVSLSSLSSLSSGSSLSSDSSLSSASSQSLSSDSSHSSSSSSSAPCPNYISSLTDTPIYTTGTITSDVFLSVNINNISGDRSYYLELFSGDTSGKTYDSSNTFYGHQGTNSVVSSGFVSMPIDGVTYYIEVFGGEAQSDCCSNIVGGLFEDGNYVSAGYIMVKSNTNLKFIQVFNKVV